MPRLARTGGEEGLENRPNSPDRGMNSVVASVNVGADA